ncbi:BZ3500_MvSof-1268-A1-R1_Chr1-1g01234 [Microbotryum saponariae]|uniref:BZ3500_MvSof-1268-A1-R1_Chr1-1g01234 protein n=1 Tax=Microbotryum saponariae TaxID=289078 RepID=A0A2X0MCI2_9BASI|nr:BZ3500_MvSof-1268-A1-R1_Chr1-1g01234 [Microbotryum saponariae]SCZ93743.1 BZ3501_MvSof-1269-A2-R1_Chr1-1g00830 [Microbotryum saponariae]
MRISMLPSKVILLPALRSVSAASIPPESIARARQVAHLEHLDSVTAAVVNATASNVTCKAPAVLAQDREFGFPFHSEEYARRIELITLHLPRPDSCAGKGCCADPHATSCSSQSNSTSCADRYVVVNYRCEMIRCAPPRVAADNNGDCCVDSHATSCWNPWHSTICELGWEVQGGTSCVRITCRTPYSVLADNGRGCCSDALALSCSDPATSTNCRLGYKLGNGTCSTIPFCFVPNPVVSNDGKGCCSDPMATACSEPNNATDCAKGYLRQRGGTCWEIPRCLNPITSADGEQFRFLVFRLKLLRLPTHLPIIRIPSAKVSVAVRIHTLQPAQTYGRRLLANKVTRRTRIMYALGHRGQRMFYRAG